jgi:hypothetical protein
MDEPPLGSASSERVEVYQSAVGSISAGAADLRLSVVRSLTAAQAGLSQSIAGVIRGDRVSLRNSFAAGAVAREVAVEDASTLFLISPSVTGNVRAVFTLPAALALGFGFFWGVWLAKAIGRRLRRWMID